MRTPIAGGRLRLLALVVLASAPPGAAQERAFVVNRAGASVAVLDASTLAPLGEIAVGDRPTTLAVTPDGKRLYVASTTGGDFQGAAKGSITVISVASSTVLATIPAGDGPWGIAITPDGERAYVSDAFEATVSVLRLSDNTFVNTIADPLFDTPHGVAVTPDGSLALVANVAFLGDPGGPENVTFVRTSDDTVVAAADVSTSITAFGPWDVTILPDGKRAYSNDGDDGRLLYDLDLDPASPTFAQVLTQIPLTRDEQVTVGPRGMASGATPAGVRVYAALMESNEVAVVDAASDMVVDRVATGEDTSPWRVRLDGKGTRLWVSLRGSGEVLVLDTATHAELARLPGFLEPADIAFATDSAVVEPDAICSDPSPACNGAEAQTVAITLPASSKTTDVTLQAVPTPAGLSIAFSPPVQTVAPGQKAKFFVTFTGDGVAFQGASFELRFVDAKDTVATLGTIPVKLVCPGAECFLLVGRFPLDLPLPWSPQDRIYVMPELAFPLGGPADTPVFPIPDDPVLLGAHVYTQVYMDNAIDFPQDRFKVSNGIDVLLGLGSHAYGDGSGMTLWLFAVPELGGYLAHTFSID